MLPDDICPRPSDTPPLPTQPHAAPIQLTSVWQCADPDQADRMLSGATPGYVYQRDGHPNADQLTAKCAELHGAEQAVVTSSGMSALSAAVLSQLKTGDHVVVSGHLYGKTLSLFGGECSRLGIAATVVDTCDLSAVRAALTDRTRMIVVETIANPRLQVVDMAGLAEIASQHRITLLVDNTFATPYVCRPLELGAQLVMESLTKMMNGHSDVTLGLLCGRGLDWTRVRQVVSTWGLAAAPFDCWLASRGLATMALRMERACGTALRVAEFLSSRAEVERVDYPGLSAHPQHALAARQFGDRFGSIVTFHLPGGRDAATRFMHAARRIPFCPSLGELSTTLSHPESTSHRGLTAEQRAALGITGGTIRLSVGIESDGFVLDAIAEGLARAWERA